MISSSLLLEPVKREGLLLSSVLCPLRVREGKLETLMVQRRLWNGLKKRPMTYGGLWVFPGGAYEPGKDENLLAAAMRECSEETGYEGAYHDPRRMERIFRLGKLGDPQLISVHRAWIDPRYTPPGETAESRAIAWMALDEVLEQTQSPAFMERLTTLYRERGYDDQGFGLHRLVAPMPVRYVITTLRHLQRRAPGLLTEGRGIYRGATLKRDGRPPSSDALQALP